MIEMILACTPSGGIGLNGQIPWKSDLKFFKETTTKAPENFRNAVIMGRKTFESIGKPLPNRVNIVLTSQILNQNTKDLYFKNSLYEAIRFLADPIFKLYKIFLIGGKRVYEEGLEICTKVYLTLVDETPCDVYINFYKNGIQNFAVRNYGHYFLFHKKHEEFTYFELVKKLLEVPLQETRSIRTKSLFGYHFSIDLISFPLLTTKKMFWRGIVEELLWFLRGETDIKILEEKKVFIWSKNGENLGPIYGKQWRDFGGVDQIKYCLDLIKNDPTSRRIFMSSWNPPEIPKMALPPCHVSCQFSVKYGELSAHVYQRSADVGLGLPFNIASYALLVYIMARATDLKPGQLYFSLGDVHIYENHISALKIQLKNSPLEFPKLEILEKKKPWKYEFRDFKLNNYHSYEPLKMDMTV